MPKALGCVVTRMSPASLLLYFAPPRTPVPSAVTAVGILVSFSAQSPGSGRWGALRSGVKEERSGGQPRSRVPRRPDPTPTLRGRCEFSRGSLDGVNPNLIQRRRRPWVRPLFGLHLPEPTAVIKGDLESPADAQKTRATFDANNRAGIKICCNMDLYTVFLSINLFRSPTTHHDTRTCRR